MDNLIVNDYLAKETIFELFKLQLKKDFEGAGLDAGFIDSLMPNLNQLSQVLVTILQGLSQKNQNGLMALLYRVDISQDQIKKSSAVKNDLNFEELLSELIIKRVLQKVIIKKSFSK